MAGFYVVTSGDGSSCGHKHRNYDGAARCCKAWIYGDRSYFREDWQTHSPHLSWRQYVSEFCSEAIYYDDGEGNLSK